jgi:hypothetical protein
MAGIMSAVSWKSQAARRLIELLPPRQQLSTLYRQVNGAAPDLRRPRLLSERILHRMLTDRDPLLHTFCDKIAAKEWIADRIGADRTPRTLGVADSVEALLALPLPERWMLKASHGCSWFQLVAAPTHPLDAAVLEEARRWLTCDYADTFQEWGYRGVPRRLMAEEFLSFAGGQCVEMSAFCFRGRVRGLRLYRPESALVAHRSSQKHRPRTKELFLDGDLQPLPLVRPQFDHWPALAGTDRQPLEDFLALAAELSAATTFLRVDGFLSDRGVLVGELTPYPGAGIWLWMPRPWDAWLGAFWD